MAELPVFLGRTLWSVHTLAGEGPRDEGGITQQKREHFQEEEEAQNLFLLITLSTKALRIKIKFENLEMGKC